MHWKFYQNLLCDGRIMFPLPSGVMLLLPPGNRQEWTLSWHQLTSGSLQPPVPSHALVGMVAAFWSQNLLWQSIVSIIIVLTPSLNLKFSSEYVYKFFKIYMYALVQAWCLKTQIEAADTWQGHLLLSKTYTNKMNTWKWIPQRLESLSSYWSELENAIKLKWI